LGEVNEAYGVAELHFDIDFIEKWLCDDDQSYRFLIAPATLTFHSASKLRVSLDFDAAQAGMTPFSIGGIEREPVTCAPGQRSFRWRLPVNWPTGEITFESPGFTQVRRGEPQLMTRQCLTASERCG
jgi:hypothetical protein